VEGIVDVHLVTFPYSFLSLLGSRALREFYIWFAESPETIGFVSTWQGKVRGFVVGWEAGASWQMSMVRSCAVALGLGAVRGLIASPRRMLPMLIQRIRTITTFALRLLQSESLKLYWLHSGITKYSNSPRKVNASLLSIAVHPDFRRKGMGKKLIQLFINEAGQRGVPEVLLSVEPANVAARNLYKRTAWQRFQFHGNTRVIHYRLLLNTKR